MSEDKIRELAYTLWEQAGSPDGRSEEFWFKAVAEVESTLSYSDIVPPEPLSVPSDEFYSVVEQLATPGWWRRLFKKGG